MHWAGKTWGLCITKSFARMPVHTEVYAISPPLGPQALTKVSNFDALLVGQQVLCEHACIHGAVSALLLNASANMNSRHTHRHTEHGPSNAALVGQFSILQHHVFQSTPTEGLILVIHAIQSTPTDTQSTSALTRLLLASLCPNGAPILTLH